jgi:hypothetical protein
MRHIWLVGSRSSNRGAAAATLGGLFFLGRSKFNPDPSSQLALMQAPALSDNGPFVARST